MSDWFYAQDSQQKGPVNEARLKEMIANKELDPKALVWREGFTEWTPANILPAFSFRPPPKPATGPRPKVQSGPVAAPIGPIKPVHTALSIETLTKTEDEEEIMQAAPEDVEKNKVFGVLAYIGLLFLVPLLAAKESPFARYHTNQGVVLFLVSFVAYIAAIIIGLVASFIPVLGPVMYAISMLLVGGVCLALMIMGIINAAKGEMRPLPLIGGFQLIK